MKLGKNQAYCVVCRKAVKVEKPKYVKSTKGGRTTHRLTGVDKHDHNLSKIVSKDTYLENK